MRTSHALKYRGSFPVETGIKDTPCSLLFQATQGIVHNIGSFKHENRPGGCREVGYFLTNQATLAAQSELLQL
jgi:hypothetical protein